MRYYSYNEYDAIGNCIITMSEHEIRKEYYPYWYQTMCIKYEQAYVDENLSFEDCLEEWQIIHQAWEVNI